ncbi:hypothetical protein T11_13313 [Trichinella zimbabwensis]|uniref:Uncharacterized protein n=1 Tax=Trichinella zimbabwensis TaxID=268475 RepID=A0A0V1GAH5_9BILA|nr:hypothetical protein T11_13313 [Trichinella zimbabwensis]
MHHNQLSKLSVEFIAQQREFHALPRPAITTPLPPPSNAKA